MNKNYVVIYVNSPKKLFSIKKKGKVVALKSSVTVVDAKFAVNEKKRLLVVKDRRKNQHAEVRGYMVDSSEKASNGQAYYNPYKLSNFVDYKTGKALDRSEVVRLKFENGIPKIFYKKWGEDNI